MQRVISREISAVGAPLGSGIGRQWQLPRIPERLPGVAEDVNELFKSRRTARYRSCSQVRRDRELRCTRAYFIYFFLYFLRVFFSVYKQQDNRKGTASTNLLVRGLRVDFFPTSEKESSFVFSVFFDMLPPPPLSHQPSCSPNFLREKKESRFLSKLLNAENGRWENYGVQMGFGCES